MLTETQRDLYFTIDYYIKANGYSPSYRELCDITHRSSPATIMYLLKEMKKKGYIDWKPKRMRTIRILKELS